MKALFIWLVGYYCVDLQCFQLHKPIKTIEQCELEINELTIEFAKIHNDYGGLWELDCHIMTNKYVGQS